MNFPFNDITTNKEAMRALSGLVFFLLVAMLMLLPKFQWLTIVAIFTLLVAAGLRYVRLYRYLNRLANTYTVIDEFHGAFSPSDEVNKANSKMNGYEMGRSGTTQTPR